MTGIIAAPYKRKEGWKAEDFIPLAEPAEDGSQRMMRISTYRHSRGGVVTYAGACIKAEGFIRTAIFQDFHAVVEHSDARCTEKTVREQHQRALDRIPELKARALAHEEKNA